MKTAFHSKTPAILALVLILITSGMGLVGVTPVMAAGATITVSGTQWGLSSCYIGANEGNSGFSIADFQDAGLNTYRLYGGMSVWEPQDDDGVYGSPSMAQIQANPNIINWAWWDNVMAGQPHYTWAGTPPVVTKTSAQIFGDLQTAGIRPVVVLRNRDDSGNPAWSPNPPTTANDWNEWWEFVFATVYWLNVRNNYHVDDWEVHNEPNFSDQGWGGTEAQYWQFVQQTNNAIQYVYATYLPGRTPNVWAPVSGKGGTQYDQRWPEFALQNVPNDFNVMDFHTYDDDIAPYTQQVHGWLNQYGFPNRPFWVTEWGDYPVHGPGIPYDSVTEGVRISSNLIRSSRPGNDRWDGGHVFSFYDWGTWGSGLIAGMPASTKRTAYYGFRIATRALQGCRPTYQSTTSTTSLLAITTQDTSGNIYVLVTNSSSTLYTVTANLSALLTSGSGTMWQYDATHNDIVVGNPVLSNGNATFDVPGTAAVLVKFGGGSPQPTATPTNTPLPPTPTQTNTPVSPTNTPTHTNTPTGPTNTPTRTNTPAPTATPGGSTVMHIAQLYTTDVNGTPKSTFNRGETVYYRAQIVDQSSLPVSGASVSFQILNPDGSLLTTASTTTDSNGWALFSKKTNNNYAVGTYTINVTNVTKAGATYDPAANVISSTTFLLQ